MDPKDRSDIRIALDHDGRQMAVATPGMPSPGLMLVELASGSSTLLTGTIRTLELMEPSFSQDGKQVVFRDRFRGRRRVCRAIFAQSLTGGTNGTQNRITVTNRCAREKREFKTFLVDELIQSAQKVISPWKFGDVCQSN